MRYSKDVYNIENTAYPFLTPKPDKESIINLHEFLDKLNANEFVKRIERNNIDIYVNDRNIFEDLCLQFSDIITLTVSPSNDDAIPSGKTILSNKFPHDRYRYKVFLKPHKIRDAEDKIKYLKWIDSQGDKIRISDAVKQWFLVTNWNWDRRYMYVDDETTLLMLKLRNSEALGSVYSYEIIDK